MTKSGTVITILSVGGTILFTTLLTVEKIGAWQYFWLLSGLAIVCLAIHGFPRLQELALGNLKLTLAKMEAVRDDVYAKEEDLRAASLALTRLIVLNSTLLGISGDECSHKYSLALIQRRTEELLNSLKVPDHERDEVFKYQQALDAMEGVEGDAWDAAWQEFVGMLKQDCEQEHLNTNGRPTTGCPPILDHDEV